MILLFTAEDKFGNYKKYSWWFSCLESSLDVLSSLTAKGRRIISAELIDNNDRLVIPVDVFDGECFSAPMLALEKQWQLLLDKPKYHQHIGTVTISPAE